MLAVYLTAEIPSRLLLPAARWRALTWRWRGRLPTQAALQFTPGARNEVGEMTSVPRQPLMGRVRGRLVACPQRASNFSMTGRSAIRRKRFRERRRVNGIALGRFNRANAAGRHLAGFGFGKRNLGIWRTFTSA
jgi:hypothetical protein